MSAAHPALSGHFPDHPVVPGVVILSEVMESLRRFVGEPLQFTGIPTAKFISPLLPGESLIISLDEPCEGTTSFLCTVETRVVARGSLRHELDSADAPPSP